MIETEGVRLVLGNGNGSISVTSHADNGKVGDTVVAAAAGGELHDELSFTTYHNLGRLCSRALFAKDKQGQSDVRKIMNSAVKTRNCVSQKREIM